MARGLLLLLAAAVVVCTPELWLGAGDRNALLLLKREDGDALWWARAVGGGETAALLSWSVHPSCGWGGRQECFAAAAV